MTSPARIENITRDDCKQTPLRTTTLAGCLKELFAPFVQSAFFRLSSNANLALLGMTILIAYNFDMFMDKVINHSPVLTNDIHTSPHHLGIVCSIYCIESIWVFLLRSLN